MKYSLFSKKIILFLLVLLPLAGYSQNYREFIKQHNLPKEYKTYLTPVSFMEMMERGEKYKSGKERKITVEFPDRETSKCIIEEIIWGYFNDEGEIMKYPAKTITYYYKSQHLYLKEISFGYEPYSIEIYFYKNGQARSFDDEKLELSQRWHIDGRVFTNYEKTDNEEGNVATITDMGYAVPVIDVSILKMSGQKYNEMRKKIDEISDGEDFRKLYKDFSILDWKKFIALRDLFAKELNSNIFKGKDIYYEDAHDSDYLELRGENGESVDIHKFSNPEYSFIQSMGDSQVTTSTLYHPNGNVAGVVQKSKNGFVGLWAKYNPDGSVIKEVDLSKAFRLNLDSIPAIVKRYAINEDKIYIKQEDIIRIYASNYGKIWQVKVFYSAYKIRKIICIDDATGKILEGNFKDFNEIRERDKKWYTNAAVSAIEKKENIKIVIIKNPWDE